MSKLERDNNAFIEDLLKKYDSLGQYTAVISCDGFNEIYDSSTGQWTIISDYPSTSSVYSSDSPLESTSNFLSDSSNSTLSDLSQNSFPEINSSIKIDIFNLLLILMLILLIWI